MNAQDDESTTTTENNSVLPYHQIPDYPETYTPRTVAARMIDGLGYRYYWATEGLRPEDLEYKASEESRTTEETMEHVLGLSRTILNAAKNEPNIQPVDQPEMTIEEKRKATLENIKMASELLKAAPEKGLDNNKVIFQRGEKQNVYPFWNMINGPIADAIWHAGQIVAFRRASGNPINPFVSVFMGKTRE